MSLLLSSLENTLKLFHIELGEHDLTPASSQMTYLLLLHFYSLHLAIITQNIRMATPSFLIRSFWPWRLLFVCVLCDILSGCWSAVGTAALFQYTDRQGVIEYY